MHILYAYFNDQDPSINKYEKELFYSLNKSYDLYHYLLQLILEVRNIAIDKIELAKEKRMRTNEDLNPNTKFIDNKIIRILDQNDQFNQYISKNKISWANNPELKKRLWQDIHKSTLYADYMSSREGTFNEDLEFVVSFYTDIVANSDLLYQLLEEKSIYWNDDIEFIISMVLKTIQKMKPQSDEYFRLSPLFKNEEDQVFAKQLFRKSTLNYKEYRDLIEKYLKNWDIDRIAFLDIVIMIMAIAEVKEFSSIPIKVTLNEYIEISKYYSTSKSNVFINGILDKIIHQLKEDKEIIKTGRGLIDK